MNNDHLPSTEIRMKVKIRKEHARKLVSCLTRAEVND